MKKHLLLIIAFVVSGYVASAQKFNPFVNKDSLVKTALANLPAEARDEIQKSYDSANDSEKEFLLVMLSMPRSSKKELIRNIDSNYRKVDLLKTEYAKLVPANRIVYIEYKPADNIFEEKESFDLKIFSDQTHGGTVIEQEWSLAYDSKELNRLLKILNWDNNTLLKIKSLLADAHCISVENGSSAEIGFARSGMGKYSYILFDKDLTKKQTEEYNNGCTHIFYKGRIVLEYGGGAIGPQCFPD